MREEEEEEEEASRRAESLGAMMKREGPRNAWPQGTRSNATAPNVRRELRRLVSMTMLGQFG